MSEEQVAIITDVHIGVRNSSKVFREMFRTFFRDDFFPTIEQKGIKTILNLGDMFDSRNSVSLHDIDYMMNEWLPMLEQSGATMYVIAGNHDVAYRNTNKINSLSMISHSPSVVVIDDEVKQIDLDWDGPSFVMCPWINNENYESIMEDIKHHASDESILCMHAEFEGMRMYQNSIACEKGLDPKQFSKYLHVLSGHFHHPSRYGNVEYIGAAGHYNWQDHDDWRGFLIYNNETQDFERYENTHSLFSQIHWNPDEAKALIASPEQMDEQVKGKIVRIIIDAEYDRVDLKDFVHAVESSNPVSVDVIDNTIVETAVQSDSDGDSSDVKEIHEYVDDALADRSDREELKRLFDQIYDESIEKTKEIE